MFLELINPIPDSIKDPSELGDFFKKFSIIPYYGTDEGTSHVMLDLLSDLSILSASHKACKIDICKYAFSNRVDIISKPIPGLITEADDQITREQKLAFNENFLTTLGIRLPDVIDINKRLYNNESDSGNAYLRIRIVKVGGTTQVFFKALHYKHCAYLRTKKNEDRILIYTKKWGDEDFWKNNVPELYKTSYIGKPFNWGKRGSGTMETVLHLRNIADESDYYGRPNILSVLYWMFTEWTQSDLAVKTGSTEFVSKMLLAFEEVDPTRKTKKSTTDEIHAKKKSDFRDRMTVIRKLTTNEGGVAEAKTLAGIEYPFGGKAPQPIPLNINRDVKFSEFQIDKSSSYIYSVHGWDKQLSGFEPARSNIGGNVLIDLFTVKNTGTILPLQNDWTEIWSQVFTEIAEEVGYNGDVYTLKYPNLIEELTEKLIASKVGKTDETLEAETIAAQEEVNIETKDRLEEQSALIMKLQSDLQNLQS